MDEPTEVLQVERAQGGPREAGQIRAGQRGQVQLGQAWEALSQHESIALAGHP